MPPAITSKLALLSASAIFGWRHIYGSRLGITNKFVLLSASAIFGWRHIYGSRLGITNKFVLLSASAYICICFAYVRPCTIQEAIQLLTPYINN